MTPRGRVATAFAISLALAVFVHCSSEYAEDAPGADGGVIESDATGIDASDVVEASTDAPAGDAGPPEATGEYLWSTLFGLTFGSPLVAVDPRGDIVVAFGFTNAITMGGTTLTSAGLLDVAVVKISAATRDVVWAQNIGGPDLDRLTGLTVDGAGDVYVSGTFDSPTIAIGPLTAPCGSKTSQFIAKLGGVDGGARWLQGLQVSGAADAGSETAANGGPLRATADGVAFAANFRGELTYGSTTASLTDRLGTFVGTLDPANGALRAGKTLASTSPATSAGEGVVVRSIELDRAGNLYVVGSATAVQLALGGTAVPQSGNPASTKGFALKLRPSLELPTLWHRMFGAGVGVTDMADLRVDEERGVLYLAGRFTRSSDFGFGEVVQSGITYDVFTLKFAVNDGTPLWQKIIAGPGGDSIAGIAVDPWGRPVIVASLSGVGSFVIDGRALPSGNLVVVAKLSPDDGGVLSLTARASSANNTEAPSVLPNGNTVFSGFVGPSPTFESPKTGQGGFVAELSP